MKLSYKTKNSKKLVKYILLIIVVCYFLLCFSQKLPVRDAAQGAGDLDLEGDQLKDNYDIALYRPITQDGYYAVIAMIEPYIKTSADFERLYALAAPSTDADERAMYEAELEQMGQDASLPLYQIYTHNCDHAARYFAAAADADMNAYNTDSRRLTPNGNFKAFARRTTDWGVIRLGESSLFERVLEFLMIF